MGLPIERSVLVVGLPQTGKTTFLAALWEVVNSGEVPSALRLERLEGDQHHLNEIRSLWADCNELARTRVAGECMVSMTLRHPATGHLSSLHFPDIDGESFQRQWNERVWPVAYETLVCQATGALLFVHPARVSEAPLILDAERLMKPLLPSDANGPEVAAPSHAEAVVHTLPPEPSYAPTQVQLIELIQFIQHARPHASPFRLCVLISAWDVVQRLEHTSPEAWLGKRLPMLHQFLIANSDLLPFEVYGVSAQGDDLRNAADLRKQLRSSDRILVIHGEETSHDITAPLQWLFGLVPGVAGL